MSTESDLAEARRALHLLMTGQRAVSVAYEAESVTYTAATEGNLRRYIAELETKLGLRKCARRPGVGV